MQIHIKISNLVGNLKLFRQFHWISSFYFISMSNLLLFSHTKVITLLYLFSIKSKSSPLVHCNFFFSTNQTLQNGKFNNFCTIQQKGLFSQQLNIHQQSSSVYLTLVENCVVLLFHGKLQGPQCRSSSTSIQSTYRSDHFHRGKISKFSSTTLLIPGNLFCFSDIVKDYTSFRLNFNYLLPTYKKLDKQVCKTANPFYRFF